MKLVSVFVTFLLSTIAVLANDSCAKLVNNSVTDDPIMDVVECIANPEKFAPVYKHVLCGEGEFFNGTGAPCVDEQALEDLNFVESGIDFSNRVKVPSCYISANIFCYDGQAIPNIGANKPLMNYLCTNDEFPPGVTLGFGRCEVEGDFASSNPNLDCKCQKVPARGGGTTLGLKCKGL